MSLNHELSFCSKSYPHLLNPLFHDDSPNMTQMLGKPNEAQSFQREDTVLSLMADLSRDNIKLPKVQPFNFQKPEHHFLFQLTNSNEVITMPYFPIESIPNKLVAFIAPLQEALQLAYLYLLVNLEDIFRTVIKTHHALV